jgi:hypothetical protein
VFIFNGWAKRTVSTLPQVWIGFIFAGAFLFAEFIESEIEQGITNLTFIINISGGVYWLFCVHRFHKILGELSPTKYPISPAAAVGYHLIPFYHFYWTFKWPIEFSKFINTKGFIQIASGGRLGFLLLISLILNRVVDEALGLVCLFGVGTYMVNKLRRQIKCGESADNLF